MRTVARISARRQRFLLQVVAVHLIVVSFVVIVLAVEGQAYVALGCSSAGLLGGVFLYLDGGRS
jgi:hypothetical protein